MTTFSGGTIDGNILPTQSGKDLGAASTRWDAFLQDLDVNGTITFGSGAVATLGTLTLGKLNNIRFVDGVKFSGADLGIAINAADADLGATPGEIWVSQQAGTTISTAVSISANHTLRFIQGGTYTYSAKITLAGNNAAIVGPPASTGIGGASDAQLIFKQANSANLNPSIQVDGARCVLADFLLDGNKANNSTAGSGIKINQANRTQLRNLTVQNAKTYGIEITSSGTSNQSCCGTMFKVMSIANGSAGVISTGTADWLVDLSEFENNGTVGLELADSPTWRLTNNDFGGNVAGISIYGTAAGLQSDRQIIVANQFGNNSQHDIQIVGYASGDTSTGSIIVGNSFVLSGNRTPDNTYSTIRLTDGGRNTIVGNFLLSSAAPNSSKYGIEITETASGRAYTNTIGANTFGPNFGSGSLSDVALNLSGLGDVIGKRFKAATGTPLVAGDFALHANWGSGAAVSAVTGTDQGWQITVTAAGTPGANPTITLTFKDLTWTNAPICITKQVGGTGVLTNAITEVPTATTNVITWNGTPVAASTYIFSSIAMGC